MGRKIYCVLMVHTQEELGSLKEAEVKDLEKNIGVKQTTEFFQKVDDYWKSVERKIRAVGFFRKETACKLRVFVDSLPNVEERLVQQTLQALAELGIPCHMLIKNLQAAGAKVHGTENLNLLLQEYDYWKALFANPSQRNRNPELENEILQKRDQAIITRINEVVPDGEIALVFIGGLHNVVGPLSQPPYNFEVIYL